jgi:hypothetical protein
MMNLAAAQPQDAFGQVVGLSVWCTSLAVKSVSGADVDSNRCTRNGPLTSTACEKGAVV